MRQHTLGAIIWLCFPAILFPVALAQQVPADRQPAAAAATERKPALDVNDPKWSVDDVLMMERVGSVDISPDARWAVWSKSVADADKNGPTSNLVLSSLTTKKEIELTRGANTSVRPRWSPDGQMIAFISDRPTPKKAKAADDEDGKAQVWLIDPAGGEPWVLTDFDGGVEAFDWAGPAKLVVAAQEADSLYASTTKESKDTSRVVDDEPHAAPVRLYEVDVKTKKATRVTDNGDRIIGLAVSPDGRHAVTVRDRSLRYEYDNLHKPLVWLYDLQTGQAKQIFTDPVHNVQGVEWTRDGKGFYAASARSSHPRYIMATITELYYYDLGPGTITQVDLGWQRGLGGPGVVATRDGFLALLANGVRPKFARYVRTGDTWRRELVAGEHVQNIFGLAFGKDDKTLIYNYTTASRPMQMYRAELDGATIKSAVQLTELNPHLQKKTLARREVVRWKGANDDEVEGILLYPHGYEAGKKYPLVAMTHGGPAGADYDSFEDSWAYPYNLVTQRGAFVLMTNYHGSSDYGLAWVSSITGGKYYDLEVPDIEKGVDSLIAKGLVDPDRLGAAGWSNGSILTIALTVNSTRYKVASAGAGDVEWASDWGNCQFGLSFDNLYFGKSPLEDPKLYMDKSPFYKLDKVRTPTIIFFGTEDRQVPTQQGWMHYRALQQLGNTDVRFLLFPGERHIFAKLTHQRRKVTEELAWMDKYLFMTAKTENEAVKPESRLALAIKLKAAKRQGGVYGIAGKEKNSLLPETVKYAGVEVGRFEVTRAQFARFDAKYPVPAGRENYPANDISFDRAKAYVVWLSKTTGEPYRLATEGEAEILYGGARKENTLDDWAGYSVNPDDAARLQPLVKDLGEGALLREVGAFKSVGDDPIFDLGGNVAEWVVANDGTGKVVGGSADTPADPRIRARKPAPDYTGFRVVKGAAK